VKIEASQEMFQEKNFIAVDIKGARMWTGATESLQAGMKNVGYVKVDRRKGAVIALDVDRMRAVDELRKELQVILAKSSCKNISRQEVHELIDEIYEEYGGLN
jgi:type III secretory pathway component EscV